MFGLLMGLVCVLMALANLLGVIEGSYVSIFAFVFCSMCAIFNFVIGIKSL